MSANYNFIKYGTDQYVGFAISLFCGFLFIVFHLLNKPIELQEMLIVATISSIVYLLIRNFITTDLTNANIFNIKKSYKQFIYFINFIFFTSFILCLLIAYRSVYAEPLIFYILVSIMACILALDIWFINRPNMLLILVLAFGIFLRANIYFQFGSSIEGLDSWSHISYIDQLLGTGFIGSYLQSYQFYPGMHIFVSSIYYISNINILNSYFIVSVAQIISYVFIYIILQKIFNEKIGMLSLLLLTICDTGIYWGSYNIIAMTFATSFLPILAYFLLEINQTNITLNTSINLFFIFYSKVSGKKNYNILLYVIIILFFFLLFSYLMYCSGFIDILANFVKDSFSISNFKGSYSFTKTNQLISVTWNYLSIYLFIFLCVIGSLFYLRSMKKNVLLSRIYVLSICFFAFAISIMYVLNKNLIIFDRWPFFLEILLIFLCTIGILCISCIIPRKQVSIIFILILIFSTVMVTSNTSTIISPIPWVEKPRDVLIPSEVSAALFSISHAPGGSNIFVDTFYNYFYNNNVPNALDGSDIISDPNNNSFQGLLMLRAEGKDNVIYLMNSSTVHTDVFQMDPGAWDTLNSNIKYMTIYDSNTVKGIFSN